MKKERLEIRIHGNLKKSIISFCDDNAIDMTYYIVTLVRNHLKKAGYLQKKEKIYYFEGNVEDMPLD